MNIKEQLDLITERFSDSNFLHNKGLSNEVGFHFFCYPPKEEMLIRSYIQNLKNNKKEKYNLKVYDLYQIFLEILEEKGVLNKVSKLEEKKGKDNLLFQLKKIATPDAFINKIYEPDQHIDIVIIIGIGKVFPFIRTHNLLENMQVNFSNTPVVVFYPGSYDGTCPKLFDKFNDGHYYRAFNLL
ncbi:MAG: DUF1788 domain-containing protein [Lachnospirales bacterium]